MILGVDYYPEQWPEARWAEDARQMGELGLKIVRIAEFAWARMEPSEGNYDWDWLDRAIDTLGEQGLQVVLGTPTAAPPAWLTQAYPETLPVDDQGRLRRFGSRRHSCPNSPVFRRYTRRIVSAMAQRYGRDRRVIGWQIDNEFGGGKTARCYCPNCITAFRTWLRKRYGSLEALNDAWGTVFWSQVYSAWDQIEPPVLTVTIPNPSQALDYLRFSSDSYVGYQKLQVDVLRKAIRSGEAARESPEQFITHNFMGLFPDLDQFKLAVPLNFAAWDSYPTGQFDRWGPILYPPDRPGLRLPYAFDVGDPAITGMAHDLTRGLKGGPFWVMEQQCGQINWGAYNPGVRLEAIRLWTWHALACGASAVVYFRWRSTLFAQEQYHSGLLNHEAAPAVGYAAVRSLADELSLMEQVEGQPLTSQVALLYDFADLWALELQPHRKGFTYQGHLFTFYQALQRLGINVDVVSSNADLEKYRLIIAPSAHIVDESLPARLENYVSEGGTLLLGVRSGFKTSSNLVIDQPLPGSLRKLAGATVRDWHALPPQVGYDVETSLPKLGGSVNVWAESLALDDGTRALAHYSSGPFTRQPALSERRARSGRVLYLGWYPTWDQAGALLTYLAKELKLAYIPGLPPGLVTICRGTTRIFLNFTDEPLSALLDGEGLTVDPLDILVRPLKTGVRD